MTLPCRLTAARVRGSACCDVLTRLLQIWITLGVIAAAISAPFVIALVPPPRLARPIWLHV